MQLALLCQGADDPASHGPTDQSQHWPSSPAEYVPLALIHFRPVIISLCAPLIRRLLASSLGVTEGYKSPSVSPVKYGAGESYFAGGSPATTPTRLSRPGLAHAYASSPPANAFISDRDARSLAFSQQQQALVGGRSMSSNSIASSSSAAAANPFFVPAAADENAMDLDPVPPPSAFPARNPSPLKRTSRARSRSPDASPPSITSAFEGGEGGPRKVRGMPLRATQSLPAPIASPPPAPVFGSPGSTARVGGAASWSTRPAEASGGAVAGNSSGELVVGSSGAWSLGSVSEWARSEDF